MNNKIKQIVKDVENGTVRQTYKRSFNQHMAYMTIFKGKKLMYSQHDETMPGVTVYFQNRRDHCNNYCILSRH